MANGYKPQINKGSISDILQLIEAFSSGSQRLRQDSIAFQGQVNDIRTLSDLNNMLPNVKNHNESIDISGMGEYSVYYNDKHESFINANKAYEKGKFILEQNLENPGMLTKDLLSGGWEGATAGIKEMDDLLDKILQGEAYKFRYITDGTHSATSIKNAIITRKNSYDAVREILDNPENAENFLVINPDGTMDDNTKLLLDKLKFNIATGDVSEVTKTINDGTTSAIRDFNASTRQYIKWTNALTQKKSGKNTLSDMNLGTGESYEEILSILDANGMSENDPLELDMIEAFMNNALENGKKANNRHKTYTGQLYNKNPIWNDIEVDFDNIEGFSTVNEFEINNTDPLTQSILDASELTDEQKVKLNIIKSKDTGEVKDVSPVEDEVKEDKSVEDKVEEDNKEKEIKLNFINSVLPDVTLNFTDRMEPSLVKENKESMLSDVENIVKIIGGQSETFSRKNKDMVVSEQHKNVDILFDEYIETGLGLTQLRKLIDQYKKFDTSPGLYLDKAVKKERLAKKILTRYNTIKGKIKKRAEIR